MRRDGFHVSHLYWPLPELFAEGDQAPSAEQFGRRVLNFWVDESVGRDWVRGCALSLLRQARKVCR